jgi:hypothetical protein
MRVLERLVRGKRPNPHLCEDAVIVTPDFAVVVDGATDKTDREFDGKCGGLFAAEAVVNGFSEMPAEVDLAECVAFLTNRIFTRLTDTAHRFDVAHDDGPSAVFVAYSAFRREVWRVGDGSWRVGMSVHTSEKQLDLVAAGIRAALLRALIAEGERLDDLMRNDPGRQTILPLLRHQHVFRNGSDDRFSYGAIDGRPVPERFLERWPLRPGTELILASDGYPVVCATLEATEKYLALDLARDPLRIQQHCETKGLQTGNESFDDRAFLRIAT